MSPGPSIVHKIVKHPPRMLYGTFTEGRCNLEHDSSNV